MDSTLAYVAFGLILLLSIVRHVRRTNQKEAAARAAAERGKLRSDGPRAQHPHIDATQCIGCGACVAACKNASAMLFVAAKVSHLNILPQGKPEKDRRVLGMVKAMDEEGFGNCTVMGSCEAVCPKEISLDFISRMNRDYLGALWRNR